jgi:GST-like protein
MITLYYFPTPNCHKIPIFLEEAEMPYTVKPTFVTRGDQFKPDFLDKFPNNRIPAIVDDAPDDGGDPISVFESGAILFYLADKAKRFLPQDVRGRTEVHKWLVWQVAGLGPICGQNHHFSHYAPGENDYAVTRFVNETSRLYAVLDKRLSDRAFIAGDYSIADMACFPWVMAHEKQGQKIADFSNVERWFDTIRERPAVTRAYKMGEGVEPNPIITEDSRQFLFGQTANTVRQSA